MQISYQLLTADDQAKVRELVNKSKAQYPAVWGKRSNCAWVFEVTSHTKNMRRYGWMPVSGYSAN